MLKEDWIARVGAINQWSRNGVRAPHKPLLLLYAIGKLASTGSSEVAFADAEESLKDLLVRYGPPGTGATPQYPFRHLETDGLWEVSLTGTGPDPGDSRVVELRERATGRLPLRFEADLTDPIQRAAVVHYLLDSHFPPSLHDDLLTDVGIETEPLLSVPVAEKERRRRDPGFRDAVMVAYERACGFCGFDGQVGSATIGLEAAHIRWHALGGPDDVANGIALCTLHHKLFDQGAISLSGDHRVMVSQHFVGRSTAARELVTSLAGSPLRGPQPGQPPPLEAHLDWHHRQVFRRPERLAS